MEVQTNNFDLRVYLSLLVRNRWWVLAAVIIGGIAAGIVAYTSPKIYEAKSTVLVENDDVLQQLTRSMAVAPSLTSKMQFLQQRLLTRDNLTQIARRLDLDLEARTPREMEALLNGMRNDIKVRASPRGQLIEIAFQHSEPTVARDVVAMLTDMLLEENLGAKRVEAHQAYDFISQQLDVYRTRLEEAERRLREFKQKNLIAEGVGSATSPDGNDAEIPVTAAFADVSRLADARDQLAKTENNLNQLQSQRTEFAKQLEEEPRWISAQQDYGTSGEVKSQSAQRIAQLESQIHELRLTYTDRHPAIVQLQAQIEQLKAARASNTDSEEDGGDTDLIADLGDQVLNPTYISLKERLSALDAQITSARAETEQLRVKIVALEKAILDVPRKEQELVALRRDYAVNASTYNSLLKRLEEARVTKEMEVQDKGGRIRVIEPATVPYKPVKPNRVIILLMGLGGGFAAGYGLGFLRHLMDNTVKSEDDVRGLVGLPVLGQIPTVITHSDRRRHRMMNIAFGAVTSFAVLVFGGVLLLELQGTGLYPIRAMLGV
jgi:polysaccharide chain length determinant protein (PEP-CTERM system associated)